MKKFFKVVVLVILSVASHGLEKSSEVDFYGARFSGFEQIGLKRLLRSDLSRDELARWDITAITVSAKSFEGLSHIKLASGRGELTDIQIPGTPESFESQSYGYSSHTFHVPSYALRDGALKLVILGEIKIDRVKVSLTSSPSYNYSNVSGIRFTEEDTFTASKVVGSSESYRIHGEIDAIRLTGVKEKVVITNVEIVYAGGERIVINELNKRLRDGESISFKIAHELSGQIEKIIVGGASVKLFGSRGKVKVELGHR